MVYAAQQSNQFRPKTGIPVLLDPGLVKAARQIYQNYFRLRSKVHKSPVGVAIDRQTYRGQLIFAKKPILLPRENFVPLEQLESEVS